MATQTKKAQVKEQEIVEEQSPFFDAARRVMLASIGAIALAQDEIEEFIDRLVERGEIAEKEGKSLVREVMDKRKKDAEKGQDELNKRLEEVLDRMKVPTKTDIDHLSGQIDDLSKKVDELAK